MPKTMHATAISLIAFAAMVAMPASAEAECVPDVYSDGSRTTCIGTGTLEDNEGSSNTALGFLAARNNLSGESNTAVGVWSLYENVDGSYNTAIGLSAGDNQTGSYNTSLGALTAYSDDYANITGDNNIAIGYRAGSQWGVDDTTISNNIAIGSTGAVSDANTIRIGTPGIQTKAFIAGIRGVSVSGGQTVVIDANGQLGVGPAPGRGVPEVPGTGVNNTALGGIALAINTTGSNNTATGAAALNQNTVGFENTASGSFALVRNTTGSRNIALGYRAGENLTTGSNNIAIGNAGVAGESDTIRIGDTQSRAFIAGILGNNISGGQTVVIDANGRLGVGPASSGGLPVIPGTNNTGMGTGALSLYQIDGENNTASGVNALRMNNYGDDNTANGVNALTKNYVGSSNTASGVSALQENATGNNNTANGVSALFRNINGGNNTAVGHSAMFNNTSGSGNTALGFGAGSAWTTGSNNIAIGAAGVAGESNTIRIGGTQSRTFIVGVRNIRVVKGQAVLVDANGQIGTSRSSIRYKEDVHTMGDASSPLMNLRPVTFRYKEAAPDGSKPIQYGLIAEEVEKVMPDLVIYNAHGTPESVAYDILPSLLLNEYQKQGRELAAAKTELAGEKAKSAATEARLQTVEAELTALKLAVGRLAAAPSTVKLASGAP
jgi:hypothetical protein